MALSIHKARVLVDSHRGLPESVTEHLCAMINIWIGFACRRGYVDLKLTITMSDTIVTVKFDDVDGQDVSIRNADVVDVLIAIHQVYSREYTLVVGEDHVYIRLPRAHDRTFTALSMIWADGECSTTRDLMWLKNEFKIDVTDILETMRFSVEMARGIYMAREHEIRSDVTKQKLVPLLQKLPRDLVCVVKSFL